MYDGKIPFSMIRNTLVSLNIAYTEMPMLYFRHGISNTDKISNRIWGEYRILY